MTPRLHCRVLDAGRLALLGMALAAPAAQADPFEAAAPVIPDETRALLAGDMAQTLTAAGIAAEQSMEAEKGGRHLAEQDDPSTVYLMAWYDNGTATSGTGTIISHPDGLSRVLTAGHVTKILDHSGDEPGELVELLAFSKEGRALAVLQPVLIGHEGMDGGEITADEFSMDVAALKPVAFASAEIEASWSDWGREIAPVQPGELMVITAGSDTLLLNRGASGSALLDGEGRVVGVLNAGFHMWDAGSGAGGSGFLDRMAREIETSGDPFDVADTVSAAIVQAARENSPVRLKGGFGVATPIVQTQLLEALGAGDIAVRTQDYAFHGTITGFPDSELRSSAVTASPLPNYRVASSFDPEVMQAFSYGPGPEETNDTLVESVEELIGGLDAGTPT